MGWETMVKSKEENKECKEKKLKDKEYKGGYRELKDPLLGKGKRHTASAMKKDADAISNKGAVVPSEEHKVAQEAVIADFEKKVDNIEIPDKDEESVILRYKDSKKENLLEKVFAYEKMSGTTIPLDYDSASDSFILSIKKSEIDMFRTFMKDFEEIPFNETKEIDERIAEVQNSRSKSALDKDNSITAMKVGKKEIPQDLISWLAHPNLSDLESIDTATEENTIT